MKDNVQNKDGLALVVGGLFILALVFATYNYFNKNNESKNLLGTNDIKKELEQNKTNEEALGDVNGEAATDDKSAGTDSNVENKVEAGTTVQNNTQTNTATNTYSTWKANDYNKGDIKGSSYTVKSGDTLWEIAEAVYGNGAEWTKIVNANSSSVGFLPNGQHALIVSGQTLVLP